MINWEAANFLAYGGGRYAIYMLNPVFPVLTNVKTTSSYMAGLRVEGATATTLQALACYFQNAYADACVDLEGIGHVLTGGAIESAGAYAAARSLTATPGLRIRRGVVSCAGTHFENNAGHDIHVGSVDPTTGQTSVVIQNPVYKAGAYEVANKAFAYLDYAHYFGLRGGHLSAAAHPVIVGTNSITLCETHVDPVIYPQSIELEGGAHWRTKFNLWFDGLGDPAVGAYTFGRTIIGNGSPEGVITAPRGWQYLRLDGGLGTTSYVMESTGAVGNTGWEPK
jgi:hypothetical protein